MGGGLLDRPAALAGVRGVALDLLQPVAVGIDDLLHLIALGVGVGHGEDGLASPKAPLNETPFQIERDRNGMKIYQIFFDKCDYNTGLPASLFTRESLDERWEKIGKKERAKEKKKEKKEAKASSSSN